MVKTGLFFGSFNPVHIGHLMIANYFYSFTDLDEVWIIVTPQNPWKTKQKLIETHHRVNMLKLATQHTNWLKVTDFEKDMELPSYTYQSLAHLRTSFPERDFILLVGGDNSVRFHQWKKFKEILKHHEVWGFPRNTDDGEKILSQLKVIKAPQFEISSEFIRNGLEKGKDMKFFMPNGVDDYIKEHQLYTNKN